jgi:beta-lactamase class D
MRRSVVHLILVIGGLGHGPAHGQDLVDLGRPANADLTEEIGDRDVVFYAENVSSEERFAYRSDALDERHAPWSTFKIPNLLIVLETSAARSLQEERVWDEQRRPAESYWSDDWKQNQTLETAFKRSAAWYFQDLAQEVRGERYREVLGRFAYGNADAPDGNDSFWLGGPLAISPREQVAFLVRLVSGQLDLQQTSIDALRSVSLLNESDGYALYGKTGSGPVISGDFEGRFHGWLVGWVEKPDATSVAFALYVNGPSFQSIGAFRYRMAARFLRMIGALPQN